MRKPKFLSPSALQIWLKSKDEYYLKYLADERPPGFPQTQPMSVGSSFDAFVKAYLHQRIYGKNHVDSGKFEFDTIFTNQVEPHNRDWAMNAGLHAFKSYRSLGALDDLMRLLEKSPSPPIMEFTAVGVQENHGISNKIVADNIDVGTVGWDYPILLGKPDLIFSIMVDSVAVPVIFDWKVNGFCAKAGVSPVRGYVYVYPDGGCHRDCHPWFEGEMETNLNNNIEEHKPDWGLQLATYLWICGVEVGGDAIVAVDQLACKPYMPDAPKIKVAQHRCRITSDFQKNSYRSYVCCWESVQGDHYFTGLTKEESDSRCKQLDKQHLAFKGTDTNSKWLRKITGRTR